MPTKVATSLVQGHHATIALAEKAIHTAMKKANIQQANGVLLILSMHFASILQNTILAVAHHAQCTQVMGCTAIGFFTEEDWVLDCPAVAVMVFGGDVRMHLAKTPAAQQAVLTLAAPTAVRHEWLNNGAIRYGGISGDATGQEKCSVWQNAKGVISGHVEAYLSGVNMASRASHGLTIFSSPSVVQESNGFDVIKIGDMHALTHLQNAWRAYTKDETSLPQHRIMAIDAENRQSLTDGHFTQTSLISLNEAKNSVTLAKTLTTGQMMSWAVRDIKNAQTDLVRNTNHLIKDLHTPAEFSLMFSAIGRGPFEDGIDHDLNIVTHMLDHIPLLGFYGNGSLSHIAEQNQLLPYSVVLNLYASV